MYRYKRFIVILILVTAGFVLAACSAKSGGGNVSPSSLEPIEGTEYSRVIITEKAFERLGIETVLVSEQVVTRMNSLSSEVVILPDMEGTSDAYWVRVPVTEGQQPMVDRSLPVLYRNLDDDDDDGEEDDNGDDEMIAEPDEGPFDDDSDDNDSALYYRVKDPGRTLTVGQRLLVEVPLIGNGQQRKVVPYAAVIYGVHGETWVYTNPEPLVYVRQPIVIDFIQGDLAVLFEGPEVGTAVVTVGVAELFGTETGVSK